MTSLRHPLTHSSNEANFQVEVVQGVATIRLTRWFTVIEAVAFKRSCQCAVGDNPSLKSVVLDFADTVFIDSSGIGALVICHKLCESAGATLRLVNVPDQVMMALSLAELDKIFDIEQSAVRARPESTLQAQALADSVRASRGNPLLRKPTQKALQSALEKLPETHPSVRSKAKRALDIVGSLVGLSLTAVLFAVVAIAIKLEDGGPILFAQTRCSWLGKPFRIWKFRSMIVDAEARKREVTNKVEGPLFKNDNDPRITRVGRFLRRTSLDECPQFWNVLKGDMSLVGTRPPTPDEIEQYEVSQWQRLNVKPGMTGEWQVNGRSTVTSFEDVVQLDLQYQRRWSLRYDIQLIIKTILLIFSRNSGAM